MTQEDRRLLLNSASRIVSAYVSNNAVPTDQVHSLLQSVVDTLDQARGNIEGVVGGPQPVMPINQSIGRDHLGCLLCGQRHKLLKRHLTSAHGLTPDAYREMFALDADYPMTAPSYSRKRSRMARQIGLGRRDNGGDAA